MKTFGLLGKNIDYSFSRNYFTEKFKRENIGAKYVNFDLESIDDFRSIFKNSMEISGINVTIPYKQEVIQFLDLLDQDAENIGAVNTIKILEDGKLKGFNTDFIGFTESLKPLLKPHHKNALILGTGGASKAVAYSFSNLGIAYKFVSRNSTEDILDYSQLTAELLKDFTIIVNCTPLGTFPQTEKHPEIPFQHLNSEHLIFDLIYNPESTKLMSLAREQGATATNGFKMLELQAEASWKIWNT